MEYLCIYLSTKYECADDCFIYLYLVLPEAVVAEVIKASDKTFMSVFLSLPLRADWTLVTQAGSQLIMTSHVMFYCQGGNVYANGGAPAVT